jgi:hypothetical protein
MNTNKAQELLLEAMLFGTSGMIERQEAQGQQSLVNSSKLPKKGDWGNLEKVGVRRGANIDELFCEATLPAGWAKVGSDHSMWSYLKDERGLTRASIFYKAAFYDLKAEIKFNETRFYLSEREKECDKESVQFALVDKGTGNTVRLFEPAYYALVENVLGVLYKGSFYSKTGGEKYREVFIEKEGFGNGIKPRPSGRGYRAVPTLLRRSRVNLDILRYTS